MSTLIRVADSKGRITLPGFANATVILEAVGPNEYRVRKGERAQEDHDPGGACEPRTESP